MIAINNRPDCRATLASGVEGGASRGKALEYAACARAEYRDSAEEADAYSMWMVLFCISIATAAWVAYDFVRRKKYAQAVVFGAITAVLCPVALFILFAFSVFVLGSIGL